MTGSQVRNGMVMVLVFTIGCLEGTPQTPSCDEIPRGEPLPFDVNRFSTRRNGPAEIRTVSASSSEGVRVQVFAGSAHANGVSRGVAAWIEVPEDGVFLGTGFDRTIVIRGNVSSGDVAVVGPYNPTANVTLRPGLEPGAYAIDACLLEVDSFFHTVEGVHTMRTDVLIAG